MSQHNVELFVRLQINVLKYCGFWSPNNHNTPYFIYSCLSLGLQYTGQMLFWAYVITSWGDLDAMTGGLNLLISHLSMCVKVTVIVVNKNVIMQLFDVMNCDIFSSQLPEHYKILDDQARKIRHVYITMLIIFGCSLVAFFSTPFFSQPRAFPFLMWMPVDPSSSPGFELGYIFQVCCGAYAGFVYPSIDFLVITLIIFGCTQIDIIMYKLKKITGFPFSTLSNGVTIMDRQQFMIENNELLVECIRQHQTVKRFIKGIEELFNMVIFVQLSGTVEVICIIAFRLSVEPFNTIQFYTCVNYLVNTMGQLYFFCWCGNVLTTRSEELRDVLYQCPWYDQDRLFKRTLMIAIECMKRPIIFRAGYFITLLRSTFVTILRLSYSYFAVLNHVNDDK